MTVFRMNYRVGYYEVDKMNALHHARFFEIFERARTELLRAAGSSYRSLEESGFLLPLHEAGARYRLPVRYDDLLEVRVRITRLTRAEVRFAYDALMEDGRVVCEGWTFHPITNSSFRPVRLSGEHWKNLKAMLQDFQEEGNGS